MADYFKEIATSESVLKDLKKKLIAKIENSKNSLLQLDKIKLNLDQDERELVKVEKLLKEIENDK